MLPKNEFQTIQGFGASDAWSIQYVGKNWPLEKRIKLADLLFSQNLDENKNPLGIGLSQWRFNIGAGSIGQGEHSGIEDKWRRAECFLGENGYDWTAQEGQLWFLKAAKNRGVSQFTAFSNSPPIFFTKNKKAYSSGGSKANLAASNYQAYVDFLASFLENFKTLHQIEFNYISPFNESQWDWDKSSGQEGSPWENTQIFSISKLLNEKLLKNKLSTKIELTEAAKLNYLYEIADKPKRANQIQDFFHPSSKNYLGNLSTVANKIAGHSYYTTYDRDVLIDTRSKVQKKRIEVDPSLEFWMTEYCVLEKNSKINGRGRDLSMDTALYVARVIHSDLTEANASSWQWWLAVSPYDYKDGLVYIDDNKMDGNIYVSKTLWSLGNFSRFIKQGFRRIDITRSDDNHNKETILQDLLVSAYKHPSKDSYVAVVINETNSEKNISCQVLNKGSSIIRAYQTSDLEDDNLTFKGSFNESQNYLVPAKSIVTLIIE